VDYGEFNLLDFQPAAFAGKNPGGGIHQQNLPLFPQLPLSHHSKKLSMN
jgi:hypothetical protein